MEDDDQTTTITSGGRRSVAWTDDEEKALLEGQLVYGSRWKNILNDNRFGPRINTGEQPPLFPFVRTLSFRTSFSSPYLPPTLPRQKITVVQMASSQPRTWQTSGVRS